MGSLRSGEVALPDFPVCTMFVFGIVVLSGDKIGRSQVGYENGPTNEIDENVPVHYCCVLAIG